MKQRERLTLASLKIAVPSPSPAPAPAPAKPAPAAKRSGRYAELSAAREKRGEGVVLGGHRMRAEAISANLEPLFEAVDLARRYDLAIMSTKGTSVTASRELIDELCSCHGIRLFVLHDFDKAGFSILGTLGRDTRRYKFANPIEVIDLGMRLGDIGRLPMEAANYPGTRQAAELNLRENGATEGEIRFLLDRLVELNAFASDELVAWVEKKLIAHGVKKVIPDDATLASAYRRASEYAAVQKAINKTVRELRKTMTTAEVPADLREKVTEELAANSKLPWDWIVTDIAEANATAKPE